MRNRGGIVYEEDTDSLSEIDTRWCLVWRILTESSIDFQAMQHKMATLWRPGKGMYVKQLEANHFLFQFYHDIDIKRVCDGSPWNFGRFQLVLQRIKEGDNPRTMPIINLEIWVQLHDIGTGFMSQRVVTDIGNYIGKFVESDANNFIGVWREYFRLRVSILLDVSLKRRMKLRKSESNWCWVNFKYENIPAFCFICGLVGHSDKFCEKLFETPTELIAKPYGTWMRAEPRSRNHTSGSKWLRMGGVSQGNASKEDGGDKSVNEIGAEEIRKAGKTGTEKESSLNKSQSVNEIPDFLKTSFNKLPRDREIISIKEGNTTDGDNNEILVTDSKRRRMGLEDSNPDTEINMSPNEEDQNQKNLVLVGAAVQARHSS